MVDFSKHLDRNKHLNNQTNITMTTNDIPGTGKIYDKKRFYLNIINGKLAQKVTPESEGAQKRTYKKKNGEEVTKYEKYYATIEGLLADVILQDSDFGEQILIKLTPNNESEVIVQLPFNSREANKFLLKLPNINPKQLVKLSPYNFSDKEDKEKKIIGMNVFQNEVKIADYYTPDKANGYPYPDKGDDGKFVYLDKDEFKILTIKQGKFLKGELEKWRMNHQPEQTGNVSISADEVPPLTIPVNDDSSGLPF